MTDSPRKVLIIAYYFPPMGLSGVQRTAKFAKYLPKYGWHPTVLTVGPTGYYAVDESLLKEVEQSGVRIIRTSSLDPNRLFKKKGVISMPSERWRRVLQFVGDALFIPDTKIGWKFKAVRRATELLKSEHFDLIFATAPPQTDFLIGARLKRRFNLPLILDYRDAWLEYPFKYFVTPLHRFLHKRLERKVLKAAERVVVTHRRVKEALVRKNVGFGYHDVVIIPQGYDPEDFAQSPDVRPHSSRTMRLVHTGTFYAGRTPSTMLHALAGLFRDTPSLRGRIELVLVGNTRREDQQLVTKLGLQNDITFSGYMEHRAAVRMLMSADVAWFVLDNDYQSPGKLYEYIGARKPILASVVEGYTKQLIEESGAGICVPLNDIAAHQNALKELFEMFEKKKLPTMPATFAERFNRLTLTGELVKHFESMMDIDRHAFVKVEGAPA